MNWTTARGALVPIVDLHDKHLTSIIKRLEYGNPKNTASETYVALCGEAARRDLPGAHERYLKLVCKEEADA